MIFENSSDVMMTSLINKKGTGSIRHLGSATRINGVIFNRNLII